MFRFVAAAFDGDSPQVALAESIGQKLRADRNHQWSEAALGTDLRIWSPNISRETDNRHVAGAGLIIGRAFPRQNDARGNPPASASIDTKTAAAIVESRGAKLARDFWGNYVAFVRDVRTGECHVVRDPTGGIPCYQFALDGMEIYFSDIADIRQLTSCRFSINEAYLTAGLLIPKLQKVLTGLTEVQEVLPGEWKTVRCRSSQSTFIWDPYDFVNEGVEGIEHAAAMVRETAASTISSLAGCFESIAVSVGGLDSSIILSHLAECAKDKTIGLTHYSSTKKGDERFYTRALADWTNIKIEEIKLSLPNLTFDTISKPRPAVSPMGYMDFIDLAADTSHSPDIELAECYFYGVGGDNIFMQAAGAYPVLDYVGSNGLGRSLGRILMNSARYSQRSLPNLVGLALKEATNPESVMEHAVGLFVGNERLLGVSSEVKNLPLPFDSVHPLLRPREQVPKGKYSQILASCFCAPEYYDPYWPNPKERVHIFLSQPMVEACLRIPSWNLAYQGIDRGFARYAFKERLPDAILRRLSKSSPEDVYAGFLSRYRQDIRSFLLDGELCRRRILDHRALERIFSEERATTSVFGHSIVQLTGWEAWARSWT